VRLGIALNDGSERSSHAALLATTRRPATPTLLRKRDVPGGLGDQ
jgi:hypothetical protein